MEIAGPHFEINETVEPTPDAAIKPAGRVESRAWTEFRGQPGYWRYTIRWPGGGTSNESAKHLQPADRIACDLKVVVSGAPFKIETYTTQTVEEVVEVALAKAGIPHPDTPANPTWQLRTAEGRQLTHLVGDAELVDGETTLFLDPEVGGGGEQGGEVVESGYIYPGWQGTEPAEGTRRSVIRNALRARMEDDTRGLIGVDAASLAFADAVEEALLKIDIGADPTGEVSPASTAMDVLDQLEIPRTREGAILDIGQRVTELSDEFVEGRRAAAECYRLTGADPSDGSDAMLAREAVDEVRRFRAEYDELEEAIAKVGEALDRIDAPQGATYAERIDRLYRELTGRAPGYGQQRAEGKVPAGTRELRIVLERISHPQAPPEFRFIELEDQDGRGVGGFPVQEGARNPFYEITIPYGRDDAWVSEVAYQAAGAATRPLLEDHPDYVFPAERVRDAVAELLSDFGIPRACTDCQEEQLEHGRKEVAKPELSRAEGAVDLRPPDEFDIGQAARERLYERLTEGPVPNPAELARVIDILR